MRYRLKSHRVSRRAGVRPQKTSRLARFFCFCGAIAIRGLSGIRLSQPFTTLSRCQTIKTPRSSEAACERLRPDLKPCRRCSYDAGSTFSPPYPPPRLREPTGTIRIDSREPRPHPP
ncbi:hypothetical protein AZ78_0786 [Lysobacter capsici AZ78]|uniref:Uncharacterized protein n=1 Tax=Lysobacter capsici AZ78 TaxID=1444315 RepID=A0A108U633_9GAMM|nr:hypothetical protein AZ78_0786 [Lysobacter capsici AZ78]